MILDTLFPLLRSVSANDDLWSPPISEITHFIAKRYLPRMSNIVWAVQWNCAMRAALPPCLNVAQKANYICDPPAMMLRKFFIEMRHLILIHEAHRLKRNMSQETQKISHYVQGARIRIQGRIDSPWKIQEQLNHAL